MPFEQFPYTNFHELNLDYLLKEVKEVKDNIDTTAENAQISTEKANEARIQADRAQAIADNVSTTTADLTQQVNTNTQNIAVNSARIDTFASLPAGSTSGNAELLDIRVAYNGATYASAGDSVRTQVGNVETKLDNYMNLTENTINAYDGNGWLEHTGVDGNNGGTNYRIDRTTSTNWLILGTGNVYDFIDYGGQGISLYWADDNVAFQPQATMLITDFRKKVTAPYKYCRVMYRSGELNLAQQLRITPHYEVNFKLDAKQDITTEIVVDINGTGDYTKLTDALAYAYSNTKPKHIKVLPGTYDIISELGTLSGIGPMIGKNTFIEFSPKALVTCDYTGGDSTIETNFSPFNAGDGSFTIKGLNIQTRNVRYPIHDEMYNHSEYYEHIYDSCTFSHDNSASSWQNYQCIGGGLGLNGYIEINNCIFESIGCLPTKGIVSYHNADMTNPQSRVIVKDSYFKGNNATVSFGHYGATTRKTICNVTNCSLGVQPFVEYENPNVFHFENITLYEWNNNIR